MDDVEQVMVGTGIELDKHVIATRGVVTLGHLGYHSQLLDHIIKGGGVLQVKAHISTGLITQLFGVDYVLGALDLAHLCHLCNALMDGSATHITDTGDLKERHACVIGHQVQDLLVQ